MDLLLLAVLALPALGLVMLLRAWRGARLPTRTATAARAVPQPAPAPAPSKPKAKRTPAEREAAQQAREEARRKRVAEQAAEHWAQRQIHWAHRMPQLIDGTIDRPFWQFRCAGDSRDPPECQANDGRIQRHSHEFWRKHLPANCQRDFCRCTIRAYSSADLEAKGLRTGIAAAIKRRGASRAAEATATSPTPQDESMTVLVADQIVEGLYAWMQVNPWFIADKLGENDPSLEAAAQHALLALAQGDEVAYRAMPERVRGVAVLLTMDFLAKLMMGAMNGRRWEVTPTGGQSQPADLAWLAIAQEIRGNQAPVGRSH